MPPLASSHWGMNHPGAVPTELTQTDSATRDIPVLSRYSGVQY